jgi:hypothetical protein
MAAGATSATLSSAAFTNFTGDYLVIDYDNPSLLEVIKCNVTGTAVASATRGTNGTSDQTHAAGAKVMYGFVPSHYAAHPTLEAKQANTTNTTGVLDSRKIQIGYGVMVPNGVASITETVTFPTAFTTVEMVMICAAGADAAGLTGITDPETFNNKVHAQHYGISTSGFTAVLSSGDGTVFGNGTLSFFYHWIAIGT